MLIADCVRVIGERGGEGRGLGELCVDSRLC